MAPTNRTVHYIRNFVHITVFIYYTPQGYHIDLSSSVPDPEPDPDLSINKQNN